MEKPDLWRRRWGIGAVAVVAGVLIAVGALALGWPRPVAAPLESPDTRPNPTPTSTMASPTDAIEAIGAGSLARVTAAAAVVDVPGGTQWALLQPDAFVVVLDETRTAESRWYRVEFEFCCRADQPSSEWVFGWVAADLETAGLPDPGHGIDRPERLVGPTLEVAEWSCPDRPEELYRIPEPVRHRCYQHEVVTIRGVLSGGDHGEALYPGDPPHVTGPADATLAPPGMESGYRLLPLHISVADPLLPVWLNDERVMRGDVIEVTGTFGPGAVVCTKEPRLEGFPPMSAEEQQLWCEQQFVVGEIHGDGPDPIVEAPVAEPLWTPPPGVQPIAGEGWTLLASATRNQLAVTVSSETVEVATRRDEYLGLWLSMGRGEPPAIDFTRQFVVRFVPPVSGTCPWIAFTGIGVDQAEAVVFGVFEGLSAELFLGEVPDTFGCTSDATPHAFLVAVDRSLAPAAEFRLRLRADRLCEECGITWDEAVVRLDD